MTLRITQINLLHRVIKQRKEDKLNTAYQRIWVRTISEYEVSPREQIKTYTNKN